MSWKPYIKPPAECGTEAGYARHRDFRTRDTNDPPCAACKAAHAEGERRRRARAARRRYADTTVTWAA